MNEINIKEEKNNNENTHTYDNGFHPKEVILKPDYVFYHHGFWFWLINKITVYVSSFFLFFPKFFWWGFRVKGKKNKKHIKSCLIISNHTLPSDIFLIKTSIKTKKVYMTSLQSNMGFGLISTYFRWGGAVPIPDDMGMLLKFNKRTYEEIKRGSSILFYPEAALVPYCDHIRPFMPGVFHYAYGSTKKIVPMVFTYHKPKGWYKLTRRGKPVAHLNILEPYYMDDSINKKLSMEKAKNELEKIMGDYFIKNSDFYYDKDGNKIN